MATAEVATARETRTDPKSRTGPVAQVGTGTQRDPLTERGRRTREALLAAAATVFENKGYPNTRISDIARGAGVAHGTVYTYFEDKAAVFQAVVVELTEQLDREWRIGLETTDPVDRIAEANRRYLDSYTAHSRLLEVVEQVGTTEPEYRELLADFRQRYVERAVAGIRRLQRDGQVNADLDPYLAGSALCAMVEGFGRQWLVRNEKHDPQLVSDTLTRLWASALGLERTQDRGRGRDGVQIHPSVAPIPNPDLN